VIFSNFSIKYDDLWRSLRVKADIWKPFPSIDVGVYKLNSNNGDVTTA